MTPKFAPDETRQVISALTESPQFFRDCCCSISTISVQLLSSITRSSTAPCLSIGCGDGMLEAVVDAFPDGYYRESIVGVEVVGKSISSLPENMQEYVPGTWSTCRLAENAIVWLFVYPRDPGLLLKYLSEFGERAVERIVWLGPNADWPDYDEILREWGDAQIVRESGLVAYETMVIIIRHRVLSE